jgi:hypothetical protein
LAICALLSGNGGNVIASEISAHADRNVHGQHDRKSFLHRVTSTTPPTDHGGLAVATLRQMNRRNEIPNALL